MPSMWRNNREELVRTRRIDYAIEDLCRRILPEDSLIKTEIVALVIEAFDAQKLLLTDEKAIANAEGFVFPRGVTDSDRGKFEALGWDFPALARQRLSELSPDRISEASIRRNIPLSDPDFERLLSIAGGVRVDTADDFVPDRASPSIEK